MSELKLSRIPSYKDINTDNKTWNKYTAINEIIGIKHVMSKY